MSKRSTDENPYPFFWLDELAEITLNPDRTDLQSITPEQLGAIRQRLPEEFTRISARLKTQAFCLYSSDHLKVVAGHYDQAIRMLRRQAAANLEQYPETGPLRQTGQLMLDGLNELTRSLYNRYPLYLPPPDRAEQFNDPAGAAFSGKILCALSADQAGIILRAATDAGMLIGRSFRKICTAIAPYLSTPWKEDILPATMRSHATRPELRDKEIAIAFLEKMIEQIKGYR